MIHGRARSFRVKVHPQGLQDGRMSHLSQDARPRRGNNERTNVPGRRRPTASELSPGAHGVMRAGLSCCWEASSYGI
jgi:hypothetical protein